MSNEITVPHTVRAEVYDMARAHFGLEVFSVDRQGKKAVAVRTELGVAMSGNKEERAKYAAHVALKMWAKSQYGRIAGELLRVFPALGKAVAKRNAAVNGVVAAQPELADKLRLINTGNPGKHDVMAMFALAQGLNGADKGEKAKLLAAGEAINNYELFAELSVAELMAKLEAEEQATVATN